MQVEFIPQSDGGTIITINGERCLYWYADEETQEEAVQDAEQYYRELCHGREILAEKRTLAAIGRSMSIA